MSTPPAALVRAIDAGKSVFTEKPAARSATEFAPVLSALRRRPVPFTVGYLNRGAPAVVEARELYLAGAVGELKSVELRMVTTQVSMRNPASWLFQRQQAGGGILAWLACHWLDALRFVTGEEVVRVQAELAMLSGEALDVEDTAALSFRTSSGAVGSLHAGYLLAGLDFFRKFLAVREGDPTPADAIDALRVLEILDAAYASAARGCAVFRARRPAEDLAQRLSDPSPIHAAEARGWIRTGLAQVGRQSERTTR